MIKRVNEVLLLINHCVSLLTMWLKFFHEHQTTSHCFTSQANYKDIVYECVPAIYIVNTSQNLNERKYSISYQNLYQLLSVMTYYQVPGVLLRPMTYICTCIIT